jgi:hypothetical protein
VKLSVESFTHKNTGEKATNRFFIGTSDAAKLVTNTTKKSLGVVIRTKRSK